MWVRSNDLEERLRAYFRQRRFRQSTSLKIRWVGVFHKNQGLREHTFTDSNHGQTNREIPFGMKKYWKEEYLSFDRWGNPEILQYMKIVVSMIGRYLLNKKSVLGAVHRAAHINDISRSSVSM